MADAIPDSKQQRAKEFMQILPLTIELAGLPTGELTRLFTPDQMDVRYSTLKTAYKLARKMLKEVSEEV